MSKYDKLKRTSKLLNNKNTQQSDEGYTNYRNAKRAEELLRERFEHKWAETYNMSEEELDRRYQEKYPRDYKYHKLKENYKGEKKLSNGSVAKKRYSVKYSPADSDQSINKRMKGSTVEGRPRNTWDENKELSNKAKQVRAEQRRKKNAN